MGKLWEFSRVTESLGAVGSKVVQGDWHRPWRVCGATGPFCLLHQGLHLGQIHRLYSLVQGCRWGHLVGAFIRTFGTRMEGVKTTIPHYSPPSLSTSQGRLEIQMLFSDVRYPYPREGNDSCYGNRGQLL
jgi:hypothetical protein